MSIEVNWSLSSASSPLAASSTSNPALVSTLSHRLRLSSTSSTKKNFHGFFALLREWIENPNSSVIDLGKNQDV